jgi:ribose transport system permease protein
MNPLKRLIGQREFGIFSVIVAIFVVMSFVSPYFLNSRNLLALLLTLSAEAVIAVGMTNLLVSGGFDLSVGSVVGLVGATVGVLLRQDVPLIPALLAGMGVGLVIGLFNGFIIAKVGINPFIVTLAGLSLFRGLTYVVTNGQQQTELGAAFNSIGQSYWLGIQTPIWYAIIFVIVGDFALRRLRFFRQNYYIGGNEKAARLSGIPVDRVRIINYVIMSVITAFAAIVVTSRMGAATMYSGTGIELRVITAVIIGGASLSGGEGTVFGSFLGSLLMVLIINILTLLDVNVYWQQFVVGAILLLAVLLDTFNVRRRDKAAFRRFGRVPVQEQPTQAAAVIDTETMQQPR